MLYVKFTLFIMPALLLWFLLLMQAQSFIATLCQSQCKYANLLLHFVGNNNKNVNNFSFINAKTKKKKAWSYCDENAPLQSHMWLKI